MSGGGKRIKHDSHVYACQATHYNWVYPQEKWTVSPNQFMSVDEICKEEGANGSQKWKKEPTRSANITS